LSLLARHPFVYATPCCISIHGSGSEPARPVHQVGAVEIVERAYAHSDAVSLVRALFEEQVGRYGYADPAAYAPPHGLLLVIYVADVPAACGGYRSYDPATGTVEIKKMYAVPDLRGKGLGRLVLVELEQNAIDHGARRAILETGVRSHAALALFRHAGYQPTGRYVTGRDPAINRAFVKDFSDVTSPLDHGDLRAIAR
jgi:GNAT superfamily N-acetyltransferase